MVYKMRIKIILYLIICFWREWRVQRIKIVGLDPHKILKVGMKWDLIFFQESFISYSFLQFYCKSKSYYIISQCLWGELNITKWKVKEYFFFPLWYDLGLNFCYFVRETFCWLVIFILYSYKHLMLNAFNQPEKTW